MTDYQIIEAVRAYVRGEETDFDISDILKTHRCYALLKPNNNQELLERVVNTAALKERYGSCEMFFKNASFPYAIVKGAVLSLAVCGDPARRVSGDIDILINRRDADSAKRLLLECGFIQGRVTENGIVPFSRKEILYQTVTSHQTAPYVKKTDNPLCPYINVDINTDILWGESEQHSDMDEVLSHREKLSLFGEKIYKLTAETEFIALCLHHYKDINSIYLLSQGSLCLGLFCDIYFYIRNAHPLADEVLSIARKLGVGRFIYVCLAYTMELFADECLLPYLNRFESERDDTLLESFGLNDEERKRWDIPLIQRIFHPDLPKHMQASLNEKDLKKIRINRENM